MAPLPTQVHSAREHSGGAVYLGHNVRDRTGTRRYTVRTTQIYVLEADVDTMTLKLKRTPGLYLVGFMASGKSTVASKLADELGWCFVDLDLEIEQTYGRKISQIFLEDGEGAFREIETETLRHHVTKIEAGEPCVIALGGGAFVQPRNWELIANNGVTVWLDCPFDIILRRLGDDTTRPLAADRTKLSEIFKDRRPLYSRADFRIPVETDDVSAIVNEILQLPIF